MTYALATLAAYLTLGVILARTVFKAPSMRLRVRDIALSAMVMPVLFVILLLCILFEELWKRLLVALDYNPPEEMRAGPDLPGASESNKD